MIFPINPADSREKHRAIVIWTRVIPKAIDF